MSLVQSDESFQYTSNTLNNALNDIIHSPAQIQIFLPQCSGPQTLPMPLFNLLTLSI